MLAGAGAALAVGGSRVSAQGSARVLRLAHSHPENDPVHKAALRMAELVRDRTGGAVEIKVFGNGQLGSDSATISAVRGGTIDIAWTGNPFFTGMAPKLNVLDLPFLFRDRAHVAKVLDGPIGDALRAELHASNLVAMSTWEVGWRHITNNRRPVRTPDDVKGLKIRTTPNPAHIKAFQLLGATPTPMAFTEVFTALETGTVDGQENPVTLILNAKFDEVQKHLSLTQHAFTTAPIVINKAKLEAMPPKVQEGLLESAKECGRLQRKMNEETELSSLAELKTRGMQVVEKVDQEPFRKIVFEEVKKDFVAKYGPELPDQILAVA
jgi:tripartite ATP-independent transporter DctP family solute receptor